MLFKLRNTVYSFFLTLWIMCRHLSWAQQCCVRVGYMKWHCFLPNLPLFVFLAVTLHWEVTVHCFSVVIPRFLQCCWKSGHCLWPSECEWNSRFSLCDLWFHWIQLLCVDAVLYPQDLQISMYNQQDPSSPATVPVLFSRSNFISSLAGKTGEWLWAEHFRVALTVLLAGCFPPFPSWLIFF